MTQDIKILKITACKMWEFILTRVSLTIRNTKIGKLCAVGSETELINL